MNPLEWRMTVDQCEHLQFNGTEGYLIQGVATQFLNDPAVANSLIKLMREAATDCGGWLLTDTVHSCKEYGTTMYFVGKMTHDIETGEVPLRIYEETINATGINPDAPIDPIGKVLTVKQKKEALLRAKKVTDEVWAEILEEFANPQSEPEGIG